MTNTTDTVATSLARNTIYCLPWPVLLERIADHSIDMIFIDPPYNTTELDFEEAIDWPAFWKEARRVLKLSKSPVLSFSAQPFTTDLINSNRAGFRYEIIMEKSMPTGFLDANRRPMRCHENLLVFADAMPDYWPEMEIGAPKVGAITSRGGKTNHYNNHERGTTWQDNGSRYPRSVWHTEREGSFTGKKWNATQKPIEAVAKAVRMYSQLGWLILDCFCGSGTLAVAARANDRDFICGDKDPVMVATTQERLRLPFERHYLPSNNDLSGLPLFEGMS